MKSSKLDLVSKFLAVFLVFSSSGCSSLSWRSGEYPIYHYEQPYDLIYLNALESLDREDLWIMQYTDKNTGIIEVRQMNYGSLFGGDRQKARFVVKRVGRLETSVELDTSSSVCRWKDCRDLLEHINQRLAQIPPRPPELAKEPAETPSVLTPVRAAQ